MPKPKDEIITFKVDATLAERIRHIPNRSEFIRAALLNALGSSCPLCGGTGILSPDQKQHWVKFTEHHAVKECPECESLYLECDLSV